MKKERRWWPSDSAGEFQAVSKLNCAHTLNNLGGKDKGRRGRGRRRKMEIGKVRFKRGSKGEIKLCSVGSSDMDKQQVTTTT